MENKHACGGLFKRINTSLERRANASLKDDDLTNSQMLTLYVLNEELHGEAAPYKEMEKRLHLAQSTTVGIISRLEKKGLVTSFEDPKNRRVRLVQITDIGKDCCRKADGIMTEAEELMLKGLSEEERSTLFRLLTKVAANVE